MDLMILSLFAVLLAVEIASREVSNIKGGKIAGRVVLRNWKKNVHVTPEFPYMAALEMRGTYICGATIIKENIVLTAAHCVKGKPAVDFRVRAGTHTMRDKTSNNVQKRYVKKKIIHERYDIEISKDYDIAILKLKEIFKFNDFIQPIKLAESNQIDGFNEEDAISLGFGVTDNHEQSEFLRQAVVTVWSIQNCNCKEITLTNSMLCAIDHHKESGICNGDSGSPLVAQHSRQNPQNDILIGIASFCISTIIPSIKCNTEFPSVFTNIAVIRGWIDTNIHKL